MLDNDEDKERLDDILENLVSAMEETHCNLQNLKNVLISVLEQLRAATECFSSEHLHSRIHALPHSI